jgi:hypothetical protein
MFLFEKVNVNCHMATSATKKRLECGTDLTIKANLLMSVLHDHSLKINKPLQSIQ